MYRVSHRIMGCGAYRNWRIATRQFPKAARTGHRNVIVNVALTARGGPERTHSPVRLAAPALNSFA